MKQKIFDIRLAQNFTLYEFIVSDTASKKKINEQYYIDFTIVENLQNLCINILQPVRNLCGKVEILSGYRCERLNHAVQGVDNSQHLTGCAADISVRDLNQAIEVVKMIEFDQLVIYHNFIHVSFSPKRLRKQIIHK